MNPFSLSSLTPLSYSLSFVSLRFLFPSFPTKFSSFRLTFRARSLSLSLSLSLCLYVWLVVLACSSLVKETQFQFCSKPGQYALLGCDLKWFLSKLYFCCFYVGLSWAVVYCSGCLLFLAKCKME